MLPLYVFSLVLGGGFLLLSVLGDLLGGHGDVDVGGDVGGVDLGGGDLGLEAGPVDVDVGHLDLGGSHVDVGAAHAEVQADAGHVAAKIFSIRTLFYTLFGFGAVGTLLSYVSHSNPLLTAGFAVLSGLASGALINTVFGWVRRSEAGMLQSEATYAGLPGRVTLPLREEVPGRIVVERGGRRIALRALPHAAAKGKGDPASWQSVVVVEMERGIARVAPVDEETLLEP